MDPSDDDMRVEELYPLYELNEQYFAFDDEEDEESSSHTQTYHNSPLNSDHDDDIHDSITIISKLDISDPLHLHPNDTTALTVVSIKPKGTKNYQVWSCAMLLALEGKNKIGFIDGSCKRSNTDEVLGKQQIRSSILSRETLPDVISAYATISSEESHRVAIGSIASFSQRNQTSAFVSNVPYSQNFQRNNQNFNPGPSRPNNVNNNRQCGGSGLNNNRPSGGSGLVCENYSFNGHTINRCFKIIGYPADFEKKKSGQNFKKQSVSNNNSDGKSSSSGFTDEQMATLISLIKDNKVGKNVQANMTVGHPNGTEAYISKIGNLRLSNGLTLYDVMVIPEYCVTLISVHKLVKENKIIVAFDENRCYFLNQDLNLKNVLGIGEQCEGMLGHPADPVLNVLKDSLNFDKRDNTGCCEIFIFFGMDASLNSINSFQSELTTKAVMLSYRSISAIAFPLKLAALFSAMDDAANPIDSFQE
ncbi:ribonuclease H-like domain-containing protein [Tanacetum coccineum]